jgi:hypothetical protein
LLWVRVGVGSVGVESDVRGVEEGECALGMHRAHAGRRAGKEQKRAR